MQNKLTLSLTSAVVGAIIGIGVFGWASSHAEDKAKKAAPDMNAQITQGMAEVLKFKKEMRKGKWRPNTFMQGISSAAKRRVMRSIMQYNPFTMQEMINMMVIKRKVDEGITFDEVVESMLTRANAENMKLVFRNTPYKILREISDKNSPRVEIFGFCDLLTMRKILDVTPEFIAFLPCRIGVLEDAEGAIWIVTLDWDVSWLDVGKKKSALLDDELRKRAIKVKKALVSIMEAGATGDL